MSKSCAAPSAATSSRRDLDSTGWVERRYGRKQGLARCVYHGVLDRAGWYEAFGRVRWDEVDRFVFVCQGNICRSAYAEARARAMGLPALSFGLQTEGGDPSPPALVQEASAMGLDLSGHRSRPPATGAALSASDLVLAVEPSHLDRLRAVVPAGVPVALLGLWGRPRRPHIEDPYGLSPAYFRTCLALIDTAVAAMAAHWNCGRADGAGLLRTKLERGNPSIPGEL